MPFCTKCGSSIESDDSFCGVCGTKLHGLTPIDNSIQTPQATKHTQPQDNVVVAITGLMKPKSFGRYDNVNLMASHNRILISPLTSKMLQQAAQEANQKAREEGGGLFSRVGSQMSSHFTYADRFIGMDIDTVAASNPGASVIDVKSIRKIILHRRDDDNKEFYELTIESAQGKEKYRLDYESPSFKALRDLYPAIFQSNIRYI